MAVVPNCMDEKTEAQRGDLGQQAGPGTLPCLCGLFLVIVPLPWLHLVLCSPLPFARCFVLLLSASPAFCANSVYCKLTSLA